MWTWPTWADSTVRQPHYMTAKLDVLRAGRRIYTLQLVSGDVNAEASRSIMRNLGATVVDPTGELGADDIDELLSPYTCEVAPHRGVIHPDTGEAVFAPLGIFRLTDRQVAGDGSVSITGQDRASLYQGPMTDSLAINGGTPVQVAIQRLLASRNPALSMQTWVTGFTCGPLLYPPDIDVWNEAQKLAQSVGGWLWHDRTGQLIFGAAVPTSTRPVDRLFEGDGRLIKAQPTDDVGSIFNIVIVESTNPATGTLFRAEVGDTDPSSPTYIGGPLGRRPITITTPHLYSVEQAQQLASIELVRRLGRSEVTPITMVTDARYDPLDVITVDSDHFGLNERPLTITAVKTPLTATEPMRLTTNRSILSRDGRILDNPEEMIS